MDEKTFGNTPAAMYLARTLTELDDKSVIRSVSRRIKNTSTVVNELLKAYEYGLLSPGTLANSLRLMRLEVSPPQDEFALDCGDDGFSDKMKLLGLVEKLTKNVQIGHIKHAIRLAQIGSKIERTMVNPNGRGKPIRWENLGDETYIHYCIHDPDSNDVIPCGTTLLKDDEEIIVSVHRVVDPFYDKITPDVLHERSDRRCKRQGKPHMVNA